MIKMMVALCHTRRMTMIADRVYETNVEIGKMADGLYDSIRLMGRYELDI